MATSKIAYNPENHDEFVALRNRLHAEHRLGGSDIGTAAGRNKYHSRLRFYNELVGTVETPDISGKQAIKDGILCEDLVAKKFEERTGKSVHRVNAIQTSDAAPHLFASIDRKVANEEAGLECKTANALNWDAFKDGRLPDSYAQQIKTYMKVTGYRTWYCYVWVMGCAELCYIYTTEQTDKPEWCDSLVRVTEMELDECEEIAADWFSRHIIPQIPPKCDGSDDEAAFLKEVAPEATDESPIILVKVADSDLDELARMKDEVKLLDTKISAIENAIKEEMGDHAEGYIGSRKITYRNNKPSSKTDWKAAAQEAEIPEEIIAKHTKTAPGARILRIAKAK